MFQYAFGHRLASILGAKLVTHLYHGEVAGAFLAVAVAVLAVPAPPCPHLNPDPNPNANTNQPGPLPVYWKELHRPRTTAECDLSSRTGQFIVSDRDGTTTHPMCAQLQHAVTAPGCIRVDGFFQDFGFLRGHRDL